jgi:prophage tail gpP-like protein
MLGFLASAPTRRVSLAVGGTVLDEFLAVDINRSLEEMTASFDVTARAGAGNMRSLPYASLGDGPIKVGDQVRISIDGELDFLGRVEIVRPLIASGTVLISGRDVACDVVDCPSDPEGKHEYRKIKLDEFVRKVVQPFGLGVKVEADVGKPFDRMVIDAGETALSAIEKYARQRELLVTSDGIGNILLTTSGKGQGAGAILYPGGQVDDGGMGDDWTQRFGAYFVKGQSEANAGGRAKSAPRTAGDPVATPGASAPPPKDHPEAPGTQGFAVVKDGAVTRYRPTMAVARTQAKNEDAKSQATWAMKTARGKSQTGEYTLDDWRSLTGQLWRPNGLIMLNDAFSGKAGQYLVSAVRRSYSEQGHKTSVSLISPEAYAK